MEQWISNLQPLHWLAVAIFLGLATLASAINNLTRELKRNRPIGKSDEAQVLESCAHILAQIRDAMPREKRELSKAEREQARLEVERIERDIANGLEEGRRAFVESAVKGKSFLEELQ
jgi:hypothetical protein